MASNNANTVFRSIEAMAIFYPISAKKSDEILPFVTIDGFGELSQNIRDISKASAVFYQPVLKTESDLVAWNAYSAKNSGWIAAERQYEALTNEPDKPDIFVPFVFHKDNTTGVPEAVSEAGNIPFVPLLPIWQISPLPPPGFSFTNLNTASDSIAHDALRHMLLTDEPILTQPITFAAAFGIAVEGPVSLLYQPVFDDIHQNNASDLVATLVALLEWNHFFDNVSGVAKV